MIAATHNFQKEGQPNSSQSIDYRALNDSYTIRFRLSFALVVEMGLPAAVLARIPMAGIYNRTL